MCDLQCPYCDKELEVINDDGFGLTEEDKHEMQCDGCGKWFVFETSISFYYEPQKADCLNGEEHIMIPNATVPKYFTMMKCHTCDHERPPTEQEKKKYKIPDAPKIF